MENIGQKQIVKQQKRGEMGISNLSTPTILKLNISFPA